MNFVQQYTLNFLMAIDQFASTILGGHPDDTISQRLGRAKLAGKAGFLLCLAHDSVNLLAKILVNEKDHCINSLKGKSLAAELWNWGGSRLEDNQFNKIEK